MSYILDALRRADALRADAAPHLPTTPARWLAPLAAGRRRAAAPVARRWVWALAALALLAVLGAWGWWLGKGRLSQRPASGPAGLAVAQAAPTADMRLTQDQAPGAEPALATAPPAPAAEPAQAAAAAAAAAPKAVPKIAPKVVSAATPVRTVSASSAPSSARAAKSMAGRDRPSATATPAPSAPSAAPLPPLAAQMVAAAPSDEVTQRMLKELDPSDPRAFVAPGAGPLGAVPPTGSTGPQGWPSQQPSMAQGAGPAGSFVPPPVAAQGLPPTPPAGMNRPALAGNAGRKTPAPLSSAPGAPLAEAPAGLPRMVISGATYSANPAHRMLVINGQVYKEGQEPVAGVVLRTIQPSSAEFEQAGRRFAVSY